MHKVILDTDIGSDIDDAVCLAYLLANPRCDLLGITTVTGEPEKRAAMAGALCQVAGKHVPIYPGAALTLLNGQRQPECSQAVALERWSHPSDFPNGAAIDFLRHTIRANPGEVTLLAIGPMTNVALLFRSDPEIPALLKELVLMCGVFTNRRAGVGPLEWNALVDPHATAIVYNTPLAVHRSIGLDVTTQVTLPAAEVRARFSHPLLRPVLDFAEVWFQSRPQITFHDPLAATTLFNEQVCTFERGQVTVELTSPRFAGHTHWAPGPTTPHEVALEVDPEAFFSEYFSVFES
jgi:inosine-uridine nucleoside N-ribohydrolase